jgi:GT2 family glycosyltransferase
MNINSIYFVAVNFNNADYTIEYVNSILALDNFQLPIQIIIVDNGSEIKDQDKLKSQLNGVSQVKLIFANENLGYFKGLNVGLAQIVNRKDSLVLIGNNDLTFSKDFITRLLEVKVNKNVMVLAPDVVTINGFHQNPLCMNRMSKLRKYGLRFYYTNYYYGRAMYHAIQFLKRNVNPNKKLEVEQYIYMGIGACYILTPNFFSKFDKLKEDVFLWSEEALLAGQIAEAGGKMLYCPNLIVHHAENTSVKKIPSRKTYEMARESFLKTFKYY